MAITTIPWNDGSGDNIYVSAPSQTGTQTVSVSSDANTGAARTQTVTFTAGLITQTLTVNQEAGTPQEYTITLYPSSVDSDRQVYSAQNWSSGYTAANTNTYATIYLTRGSDAETWYYYKFNTSSLPANANIVEVSCDVKVSYNANATAVPTRRVQLSTGTTLKGNPSSFTTTANIITLDSGTWSRAELDDVRVKVYAQRGTSNVNTNYTTRFYGATLTIKYTI